MDYRRMAGKTAAPDKSAAGMKMGDVHFGRSDLPREIFGIRRRRLLRGKINVLADPFTGIKPALVFIRVRRDKDNFMSARRQFPDQRFDEHADAPAQINGILEAEGDFHRSIWSARMFRRQGWVKAF